VSVSDGDHGGFFFFLGAGIGSRGHSFRR
jgi:hypothetical protein